MASYKEILRGKFTYNTSYSPNVLSKIPRAENRDKYSIMPLDICMIGYDIWHAYEISFLSPNGYPEVWVLKLSYSSDSTYMIESKSLKLYFNSFNQEIIADIKSFKKIVQNDLENLLEIKVIINAFQHYTTATQTIWDTFPLFSLEKGDKRGKGELQILPETELAIRTNLLRSKCRVTQQPDWGDLFVYIKGEQTITPKSLIDYIISFRDECHFHEEMVEVVYHDIWKSCFPQELLVGAIYTRRGGIDINPFRANKESLLCSIDELSTENYLPKGVRQ